jgi:hypothetical protein
MLRADEQGHMSKALPWAKSIFVPIMSLPRTIKEISHFARKMCDGFKICKKISQSEIFLRFSKKIV